MDCWFPDIRYQMHVCHLSLKQPVQALLVLQGIPAKLRSVKVNMALGKLYILNGLERPAISAFKEVIRECPLALEAIQSLIKLGISYSELERLIFNGSPPAHLDWYEKSCNTQERNELNLSRLQYTELE